MKKIFYGFFGFALVIAAIIIGIPFLLSFVFSALGSMVNIYQHFSFSGFNKWDGFDIRPLVVFIALANVPVIVKFYKWLWFGSQKGKDPLGLKKEKETEERLKRIEKMLENLQPKDNTEETSKESEDETK